MKKYFILIILICLCFILTSCNEGEFECVANEAYYINLNDTKVAILNGSKIDIEKIKDNEIIVNFKLSYTAEGLFKNLLPDVKVGSPSYKIYYEGELIKNHKPILLAILPAQYEKVSGNTYAVVDTTKVSVSISDIGDYKIEFSPYFSVGNEFNNVTVNFTFTIE